MAWYHWILIAALLFAVCYGALWWFISWLVKDEPYPYDSDSEK